VRQCGELLSTNVHFLFPLELFRARLTLKRWNKTQQCLCWPCSWGHKISVLHLHFFFPKMTLALSENAWSVWGVINLWCGMVESICSCSPFWKQNTQQLAVFSVVWVADVLGDSGGEAVWEWCLHMVEFTVGRWVDRHERSATSDEVEKLRQKPRRQGAWAPQTAQGAQKLWEVKFLQ
jgi:hypothetical protein